MSTIVLSDHDSFVDFFRKFAAGEITNDVEIKFEPPKFEKEPPFLSVQGYDYNGTVNVTVMEVLLAYQKNINTLYSLATYGRAKRLKAKEIEAIKVVFEVQNGSSVFDYVNFDKISKEIISKITGRKSAVTVASGLLFLFSNFGAYYYVANKNSQERQLDRDFISDQLQLDRDLTSEQNQLDRDFISEQSQLDRDELQKDRDFILKIIKETDGGQKLIEDNNKFSGKLQKLSKHAEVVEYSGHRISSPLKNKIPKEKIETQLNGKYRILRLDAEHDTHFKAKIENVATGDKFNAILKFNAELELKFTHEDELSKMYQAFVERTELDINVNIIILDGKIINAFVMSINEPVETE